MKLIDTHCHIQFDDYPLDTCEVIKDAKKAGVEKLIVVGDSLETSAAAVELAFEKTDVYAVVGVHPHNSRQFVDTPELSQAFLGLLARAPANKIVAVGEIGLDYFYDHSPKEAQGRALRTQLGWAQQFNLPVSLHIREAFADFWPIYDEICQNKAIPGVVHSFTGTMEDLDNALARGLYVALNGIMTFTRDENQLAMAQAVPLERLLLETDAPFLTPKPFRGKICTPEHVVLTAEFLADLRGGTVEALACQTTQNAVDLFKLT